MDESRASASAPDDSVGSMPKTLTGAELQLDDGPARDAELFLVDGNNLAYRAFFALPEELATTEGFPTNALLGFTNMLFKLLSDYRPKGVAVAWDTRPVERLEVAETYKADRRPTPGLLSEQFPHFRPDRRGLRLPEPRVRRVGGGRRHCDTGDTRGRSGDQDLRRLDRPRRVPARLRQRRADDDAARCRGRECVHAGSRRGAVRHPSRPDPRLHRPQGRHVGQHPGHPGHRRQDRGSADRAVRLARGSDRARRRAVARAQEERHRIRRAGGPVEAAGDDAPRPRARLRSRRARAATTGPFAAARDVPALRVPQPARARRHPRRGRPGAADARAGNGSRVARRRVPRGAGTCRARDPRRPLRARARTTTSSSAGGSRRSSAASRRRS